MPHSAADALASSPIVPQKILPEIFRVLENLENIFQKYSNYPVLAKTKRGFFLSIYYNWDVASGRQKPNSSSTFFFQIYQIFLN